MQTVIADYFFALKTFIKSFYFKLPVRYCECIAKTKYSLYFLLRNFTSLYGAAYMNILRQIFIPNKLTFVENLESFLLFIQLVRYILRCINVEQKQYLMRLFFAYKEMHI
jgi:hypothetical protein